MAYEEISDKDLRVLKGLGLTLEDVKQIIGGRTKEHQFIMLNLMSDVTIVDASPIQLSNYSKAQISYHADVPSPLESESVAEAILKHGVLLFVCGDTGSALAVHYPEIVN